MGYRISADPPTKQPGSGIPVSRMIITLGVLGLLGLIALSAKQIMGTVNIVNIPLVGEWQATQKPWRLVFRPDNTIVSSTGPSQLKTSPPSPAEPGAADSNGSKAIGSDAGSSWTAGTGTYSVDYSGTLWVKLSNGKYYTAALSAASPNRFDLIESGTDGVTAFQRAQPPKPNPPESLKKSPGSSLLIVPVRLGLSSG